MNIKGVHLGLHVLSSGDSLLVPASVLCKYNHLSITAFIDSGAAGNFLDLELAGSLNIPMLELEAPIIMQGLDGNPLLNGSVRYQTPTGQLLVGRLHSENLVFSLFQCPAVPLVLSHPWLVLHNPTIDWKNKMGFYLY